MQTQHWTWLKVLNNGVSKFIFISSIKVNGENTAPNKPFDYNSVPILQELVKSKYQAEQGLRKLRKNSVKIYHYPSTFNLRAYLKNLTTLSKMIKRVFQSLRVF